MKAINKETLYLMKSPANHKRIMDALNSDPKKAKSFDDIKKKFGDLDAK